MTSRELVIAALRGEPTPRPPVICGGGMMSFAVREAMASTGCAWPEAHHDPELMAKLALETQRLTRFDGVSVPFCMTIEAEALGAELNFGTSDIQPRVAIEPMATIADLDCLHDAAGPDRREITLQAIALLREMAPEVAVIGATVGPLSLAAQVLEASLLFRALRRKPQAVHELLHRCTPVVSDFATRQVAAGADAIVIADPTATGEILGDEAYREFAEPYLCQVVAAVRDTGAPVIVHICGCPRTILGSVADLEVECVSVDETANLRQVRAALTRQRLMGNLSADLLERGPASLIAGNARQVLAAGVDILAPACGVIARTPAAHLRVLAEVAGGSKGTEA